MPQEEKAAPKRRSSLCSKQCFSPDSVRCSVSTIPSLTIPLQSLAPYSQSLSNEVRFCFSVMLMLIAAIRYANTLFVIVSTQLNLSALHLSSMIFIHLFLRSFAASLSFTASKCRSVLTFLLLSLLYGFVNTNLYSFVFCH